MITIVCLLFLQVVVVLVTVILAGVYTGIDTYFSLYLFFGLLLTAAAILFAVFRAYRIGKTWVCPPLNIVLWVSVFLTFGVILTQSFQLHLEEYATLSQYWWLALSLTGNFLFLVIYLERSLMRNPKAMYNVKDPITRDLFGLEQKT